MADQLFADLYDTFSARTSGSTEAGRDVAAAGQEALEQSGKHEAALYAAWYYAFLAPLGAVGQGEFVRAVELFGSAERGAVSRALDYLYGAALWGAPAGVADALKSRSDKELQGRTTRLRTYADLMGAAVGGHASTPTAAGSRLGAALGAGAQNVSARAKGDATLAKQLAAAPAVQAGLAAAEHTLSPAVAPAMRAAVQRLTDDVAATRAALETTAQWRGLALAVVGGLAVATGVGLVMRYLARQRKQRRRGRR